MAPSAQYLFAVLFWFLSRDSYCIKRDVRFLERSRGMFPESQDDKGLPPNVPDGWKKFDSGKLDRSIKKKKEDEREAENNRFNDRSVDESSGNTRCRSTRWCFCRNITQ